MSTAPASVLAALRQLAVALGGVEWVQGAGGNASVKHDGTLWVKASGKLFRDTHEAGGHVGVPLDLVLRGLADDTLDDALFSSAPRPSMETWFHALPYDVVSHVHPLDVALVACTDRPVPTIDGVPVIDVPYVRPGKGLAHALFERRPQQGGAEALFLLRNHGLVVGAGSVERAVELTRSFAAKCREGLENKHSGVSVVADWLSLPAELVEGRHIRILPSRTLSVGRRRHVLFPDAVVYGAAWPVEHATREGASVLLGLHPGKVGAARVMEDDEGRRVLVARDASELARATEIAAAHDWVESVLAPAGLARYLDASEPAALLALPAERFRQALGAGVAR